MEERQQAICNEEEKAMELAEKEEPGTKESRTQSEEVANAAIGQCRFFHTPDHQAFVVIDKDGHEETWAIKSQHFDRWLRLQAYKAIGRIPSAQAISDTKRLLEAEALINSPVQKVHIRFSQYGEDIYIDLANESWEQIRVSKDGYQIVPAKESPARFMRTPAMQPLPYPQPGEPFSTLREFLNVEHEGDLILIISWLIGATRPDGPFPILMLQGEHGTAKTFTAKLLCSLLDPSELEPRGLPKTERDLAISATKAWVLCFDNLSHLEGWLSDAFCRVATGGGLTARTLYTDDSETIFRLKRPLIMNGISDIATRHDLADRSIIVNLPVIPEEKRRSERQLNESWRKARPQILAALYSAISTGLQSIGQVKLERSPRMADFAEWITAAEPNLPWEKGAFQKEYDVNRDYLVDTGLDSDEVGSAVLQFMKGRNEWTGTPTDLLKELNEIVPKSVQIRNYWPKRPNTLSNRLIRVAPVLRKKGIEVERSKSGKRNIRITKIAKTTDLIVPIVRLPERIRESGIRPATGNHGAVRDPSASHRSDQPVARKAGGQGDVDGQKEGEIKSNDPAEPKTMEAGREQGEL
jgi:putative DNA primase/helicase